MGNNIKSHSSKHAEHTGTHAAGALRCTGGCRCSLLTGRLVPCDRIAPCRRKLKKEDIQKYYDIKEKLGPSVAQGRGARRAMSRSGRHAAAPPSPHSVAPSFRVVAVARSPW